MKKLRLLCFVMAIAMTLTMISIVNVFADEALPGGGNYGEAPREGYGFAGGGGSGSGGGGAGVAGVENIFDEVENSDSRYIDFNEGWKFHLVSRKTLSLITGNTDDARRTWLQNNDMNDIDPEYLTADVIDPLYDDSGDGWRTLNLPHDWSIEGTRINSTQGTSDANSWLEGGLGWYRKKFYVPEDYQFAKRISIDFEGVFELSTVYINGEKLSKYPSGYTGFAYELTDYLRFGDENTIVVKVECPSPASRWYTGAGIYRPVKLVVTGPSKFVRHSVIYNAPDFETQYKADGSAILDVKARIDCNDMNGGVALKTTVYSGNTAVVTNTTEFTGSNPTTVIDLNDTLIVPNIHLWSIEDPFRYNIVTELLYESVGEPGIVRVRDKMETKYGFRYFKLDPDTGFSLNDKYTKLQGVDLHHDQGALGSAGTYDSFKRQMEILKSMGVNAFRTSHNPHSKELIDVCSELGIVVMEESFDGMGTWKGGFDFGVFYWVEVPSSFRGESIAWTTMPDKRYTASHRNLWSDWQIQEMVYRDLNEPCVIMYSIGNEGGRNSYVGSTPSWYNWTDYRRDVDTIPANAYTANTRNDYTETLRHRNNIKDIDPQKRAVTYGGDQLRNDTGSGQVYIRMVDALDGFGLNYNSAPSVDALRNAYSTKLWFESESSSQTSTRGVYFEPELVNTSRNETPGNRGTSSYDNMFASWTMSNEYGLKKDRDREYFTGQFIWTGFDYLGEPTPWFSSGNTYWEVGISFFGTVDTAGFPKDSYYLYRSQWTDVEEDPMVHILPMNWNDWYEGEDVEVWINTNAYQAELFLNGESLGVKKFDIKYTLFGKKYYETSEPTQDASGNGRGMPNNGTINTGGYVSPNNEYGKLHLTWRVPFEEGELEVVAKDEAGNEVARDVIRTAGKAHTISMKPDKEYIRPDGRNLVYVECDIVDEAGTMLPSAGNLVKFDIEGGVIVGVDNGKQESTELYKWEGLEKNTYSERSAFNGKVLAIIQADKGSDGIKLTASSDNLVPTVLTLGTTPGSKPSVTHTELGTVESIERKFINVALGNATILPRDVKVTYSSGITLLQKVTWDDVDDSAFQDEGSFTVAGTFDNPTITETAFIDVNVSNSFNRINLGKNETTGNNQQVASATDPLATASFTGGTATNAFVPNNMLKENNTSYWINTNNIAASTVLKAVTNSRKIDHVITYWPTDVTFDEVNLYFTVTTSGTTRSNIPSTLKVQYWDGFEWVDAKNQNVTMATTSGAVSSVTFDQVTSSKVRVIMYNATPQNATTGVMQVTQFRTYGDAPDIANAVTLSLDANGGTGIMADTLANPGANIMLRESTFTPPYAKKFVEWNTSSDGEGDSYPAGSAFVMPAGGATLYAIWEDILLIYDKNGGLGTDIPGIPKDAGELFIVATNPYTARYGMEFVEWNTEPDGSGIPYIPGEEAIMGGGSITLFAIWEQLPFSVEVVTVIPDEKTLLVGSEFTFTALVGGEGYYTLAVRWSIEDAESIDTSIDEYSGTLTIADDETAEFITVIATSVGDPDVFGTAVVTIIDDEDELEDVTIEAIIITPSYAEIPVGGMREFVAEVIGENGPDQAVVWSVEGGVPGTEMSPEGTVAVLYVAPDETAEELTVIATSLIDSDVFATATVVVFDPAVEAQTPFFTVDLTEEESAFVGDAVTLSVTAMVTDAGTLSYQWYKDGIAIDGATDSTFTIEAVTLEDGGSYMVIVKNKLGISIAEIESAVCVLTVSEKQAPPDDPIPPSPRPGSPSSSGGPGSITPPQDITVEDEEVPLDVPEVTPDDAGGANGADGANAATDKPVLALDKSGAKGYVNGYPDGAFRPNDTITRYETAVMFYALITDPNKASYRQEVSRFSDVDSDKWYSEAVGYLAAAGVISGYPDGTFKGDDTITRAEFVTIAAAFGEMTLDGDMPFSDVPENHWAFDNILSAYNNGWVSGYPDGTFGPNRTITRAEAVVIINNILGWDIDSAKEGISFTDVIDGEWYYKDVMLAANGI